jgi:hypothetical protein
MFRIINWMIDLPEKLERELRHDIEQIEKEKQVTYLSSMDRAVMALGAREGRKKGLREDRVAWLLEAISVVADAKFGSVVAKSLIARLENAGIDVLKKVQLAVATSTSNEELNRSCPRRARGQPSDDGRSGNNTTNPGRQPPADAEERFLMLARRI